MVDGSAYGSSTTNSVRWAGKTCSLTSTGRPRSSVVTRWHLQQRRAPGHLEQAGVVVAGDVGADRLRRAAQAHAEQLVERVALDVVA